MYSNDLTEYPEVKIGDGIKTSKTATNTRFSAMRADEHIPVYYRCSTLVPAYVTRTICRTYSQLAEELQKEMPDVHHYL